jgi:nitroimidazol reductase NimA-like FMN-containing flavoprotein (pyridoxamine 5'-phosphate oxidase superfamily)
LSCAFFGDAATVSQKLRQRDSPCRSGEMRRKDKEITDKKVLEEIIAKATICRIGLSVDGKPYVFPVNYGYDGESLYFHSAQQGQKIEMIKKNPCVCFQMDTDVEIVPATKACDWSIKYRSVIGYGKAEFLLRLPEKRNALSAIMSHYSGRDYVFSEESLASVCIVRIHIEKLSGKKSGDFENHF